MFGRGVCQGAVALHDELVDGLGVRRQTDGHLHLGEETAEEAVGLVAQANQLHLVCHVLLQ